MSGGSSVAAYVAAVDRVLSAGVGVFPEFGGGSGRVDAGGGPGVPGAPSGGRLQVGVDGAGDSYRQGWRGVTALDADTNTAAADGRTTGEQGRTGSSGVRDTARSQAAAIAPATGSPAGAKLMVSTMDERLAAMQQQIDATKAQNKLLAVRLRQVAQAYRASAAMGGGGRSMMPGGMPSFGGGGGGMPSFGGGGGGIPGVNALSSLSSLPSQAVSAMSGAGGGGEPGRAPVGGGPLLTRSSTAREVAARIIAEAHRRGYNREQIIAILSTGIQESGLNPRAIGGGGAWHGIFQQDGGYPGRDDPNRNIDEFLRRLDAKRNSAGASSDMFRNIFWLQQRPGEPSADQALANGRVNYLHEIRSQLGPATRMYEELTAA